MDANGPRQLAPRIEADPAIVDGKPVIAGTRLSVETILEQLASGYSFADLLDAYPFLSADDIAAALTYGAHLAAAPARLEEPAAS